MKKGKERVMIGSLVFSSLLLVFFGSTGNGVVLSYALLGLLVSFACAMFILTDK
ncbi:MAG: hypothetical protein OEX11_01145 [Nitrosomonas sp.]|nr:hypothetical protein [Nitrosomonas sp.]